MTDTRLTSRRWAGRAVRWVVAVAVVLVAAGACGAAPVRGEGKAGFGFRVKDLATLAGRFATFNDDLPPAAQLGVEKILAFEEHPHFVYVRSAAAGDRRIVFCKPATFIVFDVSSGGDRPWVLAGDGAPKATGRAFSISEGKIALTGQALVTDAAAFAPAKRFVHVLHVGSKGEAGPEVTASETKGTVTVKVAATDRTFMLSLPGDPNVPGSIAVAKGDKALLARRPLPASVMPHGAKGVRMMDGWDATYRRTRMPGWDVGRPASELKAIVENGTIRPGKALVVGCGTGTNAVYLASKGFEVTGVEVAPTALVLAEQRAAKAKVRVRWLVADVVALPEIGSFDFIFDRGCYHHVQRYDAAGFVKSMDARTAAGSHFLLLAGNANEPRHYGPPRVEETQLVENFARTWDFVSLKEIRFESRDPARKNGPWAWSALLRRRAPKK